VQDAYDVLGLPDDSDDATIRRRYLELVRQFTPEHHPQKFAEVRAAYERLKDLNTRLRHRLFEAGRHEGLEPLIEELTCRSPRRRVSLATLLSVLRKP
jgi:curved DNA-binding protein CbpA